MKILLLKEKISFFELPKKVSGNIWISDDDEKGNTKNMINVEATPTGEWQLVSNDDYYAIVDSKKVSAVVLKENSFFMIKETESDKVLYLYCSPIYDNNIKYYSASTSLITGISIGSDLKNKIVYKSKYVNNNHAQIVLKNDKILLTDLNTNYGTYLNNKKILNSSFVDFGDVIFIMGLKIIILKIAGIYVIGVTNIDSVSVNLEEYNIHADNNSISFEEPSEEKIFNLYSQDEYFHKKPRKIYSIDEKTISIDAPPQTQIQQRIPLIVTVGPMMTISLTSGVMIYSTVNSILIGDKTVEESMTSLVTSGVMMISFLVWPIVTNLFQKRMEKSKEKKRQKKYSEYIEFKKKEIEKEKENQENILRKKYPTLKECEQIILKKEDRLWEKRVEDDDFFCVSLGIGSFPMKIKLNIPEDHFSLDDDNLRLKLSELKNTDSSLTNVPFEYSLNDNFLSAIVGEYSLREKLIKNILMQLMTFHSYDNLKIAIFTTKENEDFWNDFKILPHCFDNDKNIRFFATNSDEYKELSYNLERILAQRREDYKEINNNQRNIYNPVFLILTDSFPAIRNIEFINNIVSEKRNLGFSTLILTDKIASLPDQCQTFIELSNDVSHVLKSVETNEKNSFKIDEDVLNYYECIKTLSNIPIEINDNSEGAIPKKVGFLEMYDIGKVEQFNCLSRWKKNVPLSNMNAIVGIGRSGEKIGLDLHEKFHGPHGLIAGMTGSGKSEFLITYILSLAVNYHPYEVQFILIDYKGGGLAGAFENATLGYKLPHLVGVVTNLDKTEINRSIQSIESELKRRQALFNKARELSGESTIDIYKYQKLYRNKVVDEPVSHLLIIADEFAELKTQQPEFMEQLISTARIGRSLGVHLILATQKPSGVVDAQIWSNTRFRVCLRVQEKSDSTEVIKRPDAAYLTHTGRFYLQVGYNEIFELGQSAWAGGKYIPSESIKKTIDSTINFIDNTGYVIESIETKEEPMSVKENNLGEELSNIVQYMCSCAEKENIVTKPLWLEKIASIIPVEKLINKYSYKKEKYNLNPVIGEYDVPNRQEQHLLTLPFGKYGNAICYGMAGSGKENFITTMIYSSMLIYTPEEVNYYILDFGAEILRYFDNSPIVGDIVYINEEEKIKNLFKKITDTIQMRKSLFSDYNGDYKNYCKNSGKEIPAIVVVINNFEAYSETYEEEADKLIEITRDSIKYGVYFLITCNTPEAIRFKLKQNFGNIYTLQQNSEDDYVTILGNVNKTYPSKIFGRGIIKMDNIYEFQTAIVSDSKNLSTVIKNLSNKLSSIYDKKADKIPILPETVVYDEIKEEKEDKEIIIGIEKNNLTNYKIDFSKYHVYNMMTTDFSLFDNFINPFIKQYQLKEDFSTIIINAEDFELEESIKSKSECFDTNFNEVFKKLKDFVEASVNQYNENNFDKSIFNNVKKLSCIIIGINSFKNKLNDENQKEFSSIFTNASEFGLINYILFDTVDKFKGFQYDDWYKQTVSATDGIWFGSGINDQFVLNISKRIPEMKEEIENNLCFVVRRGKPTLVKYIEKIEK